MIVVCLLTLPTVALIYPSVGRFRRTRGVARPTACAVEETAVQLPSAFLPPEGFSAACSAHEHVLMLKRDAPLAFRAAPTGASCFSEDIILRGDFKQTLARGRDAYLRVLAAVARLNTSPLVPFEAGEIDSELDPRADQLIVRWAVPVTLPASLRALSQLASEDGAAERSSFPLSGVSAYQLDARGYFCEHVVSDVRIAGRRLPSSELGAWLELLQQRAPAAPAAALALLGQTLTQQPAPPAATPATPAAAAVASSTDETERVPAAGDSVPPPGSDKWPAYEALHRRALSLGAGFSSLLESQPELDGYDEEVELRAASGELLLQGRAQYAQLVSSLQRVNTALTASPLLSASLQVSLEYAAPRDEQDALAGAAAAGTVGDAPPGASPGETVRAVIGRPREVLTVRWRYEMVGRAGPGRPAVPVVTLAAASDFGLSMAPPRAVVEGATKPAYRVTSHTLRDLTLNGQPALPAPLLAQLRRAEGSSPELLSVLTAAFLTL